MPRTKGRKKREKTATRRAKNGASDGKTVIVSESEDNYSDRGLHKRERSSPCERGGGNKRVREQRAREGGGGRGTD